MMGDIKASNILEFDDGMPVTVEMFTERSLYHL